MNLIFTEYVRSLDAGVEPSERDFDAVWEKLRDALRSEMIKRSVWSAPPSCLGVFGGDSWFAEDSLEELLSDCYSFIFVRRLPGLEALLEVQDNVEGLVFRNIRHFLFEKQKHHDPVGYRVFYVLQLATRQSIDAGTLHILAGDPNVRNATILAFGPEAEPPLARSEDLGARAAQWCDELLPDLMTARGGKLDAVVGRLSGCIARLPADGIDGFRFKDLIGPFKKAVRGRWQAIWLGTEGETAFEEGDEDFVTMVRLVRPDSGFEERDVFHKLLACVAEALDRLETRRQTRAYLDRLWTFLRSHAAEDTPSAGDLPSRRKIAELLDLPRYRLPELNETLGRLVETCRTGTRGTA
jgi:hypothetical protein